MGDRWECPVCGWIVSDCEYLHIVFDPDCQVCGVRKWSEFKFIAARARGAQGPRKEGA